MATTEERAEPEFPPHRMTIERYERMVEAGVYGDQILVKRMPEDWHTGYRLPLAIGLDSVPEPDLMVVRGNPRDYVGRSRRASDVAILIEVSDSSVALDLNTLTKQGAYAGDGVSDDWVVDLSRCEIMAYSHPSGLAEKPIYKQDLWYGADDEIPVILDRREVGRVVVKEILP